MNFPNPLFTRETLRDVLSNFDTIPDEHRLKLWMDVMLQLPNNKMQYLNLRDKGKRLPLEINSDELSDSVEQKRISRVARSILAHCPSLRQFPIFSVVKFIKPFSHLLASHELVYFESMLCILVNWCQHWFDHIPSPPYTLLSMLDILFLKSEPELYRHLSNRGIRAMDYAWNWMSNAFHTIVDPREWLTLWDHILVNEPFFVYFIPLAACKLQSRSLLNMESREEIMDALHSSTPLDAVSILREAYSLNEITPADLHPVKMTHTFHPLILGSYPTLNPTDIITINSEITALSNLSLLLVKVRETAADVEDVLREGMAFRKYIAGIE